MEPISQIIKTEMDYLGEYGRKYLMALQNCEWLEEFDGFCHSSCWAILYRNDPKYTFKSYYVASLDSLYSDSKIKPETDKDKFILVAYKSNSDAIEEYKNLTLDEVIRKISILKGYNNR